MKTRKGYFLLNSTVVSKTNFLDPALYVANVATRRLLVC